MEQIRGLRVGSLIMYLKTQCLKKLDVNISVKDVHCKPEQSVIRVQKLYDNLDVPINGLSFQIANLNLHSSWKLNIEVIKIKDLDKLISELIDEELLVIKN
ncbi:hypothetical protein JZM37_03290 [Acinetobacter pittii]|uniref:hypothetical protein n=1 Tax=Acinetobacter pittii TaxID=48296 RepID=UPI0019814E9D|nr:hypothetical protein [Acinetobacter pittii]MBN6523283.1 hypothetical protein [Acinetobacter pittii]